MKLSKNPEVSVIIVHYGATKEIFETFKHLAQIHSKKKNVEFLLVDNDERKTSGKKIANKYKWVKYLNPGKNLGFGGGRNYAERFASGKYLLMMDSDVVLKNNDFVKLLSFIKSKKDSGIVAPKLVNISGKYTPSATLELTPLRGIYYLSLINKYFGKVRLIKNYLLSDWDRKGVKKVDVAQLGAFFISRKDFIKSGKFDEQMFLYFEENDLAKRVQNIGKKVYLLGDTTATHLESTGTPKSSDKIQRVFRKSRFRYFSKHYGYLQAMLVDFFANINKESLIFAAIFILGAFLRFYKVTENLVFNGEMGYDYLTIKGFADRGEIPLIGPRTSHEWFFIGPIFYWIFELLFIFTNYKVESGAYFFAILGSLAVPICYKVVKHFFGSRSGLVSSFLLSISPLWVALGRDARFNAFTAILFFPFYYLLVKNIEDNKNNYLLLGLLLGIMFSFFPSPILLVPAAFAAIYFFRKKFLWKDVATAAFGFLIPLATYIYYNLTTGFEIISNLAKWIPYRILGFVGLYQKNTVSKDILASNFNGVFDFFRSTFFRQENIAAYILFFVVVGFFVYRHNNLRLKILLMVSAVSYLGLFLHGAPPSHYYLVIYPVPIILTAVFLDRIMDKYIYIAIAFLIFVSATSLNYYFSDKWFFVNNKKSSEDLTYIPFTLQKEVASYIAKDSMGATVAINRVGPLDQFRDDFSLNYQYLLNLKGVNISKDSDVSYTIYEDTRFLDTKNPVHWVGNIAVVKYEK